MTLFESKLCELLRKCEEALRPAHITTEKWQIIDDKQMTVVKTVDDAQSIYMAFVVNATTFKTLTEYKEAEKLYARDTVYGLASESAGHWGNFDVFLAQVLQHSAELGGDGVIVDYSSAVSFAKDTRKLLDQKLVKFRARARLFGVKLTQKTFKLSDGVFLHRLTREQRNNRMPRIEPYFSSGTMDYVSLGHSPCEMRVNISVPVKHEEKNTFFSAHNEANRLAKEVFDHAVGAILAAKSGRVLLGDVELSGGIPGISSGRALRSEFIPSANMTIRKADIKNIGAAHSLITGGSGSDKILQRSIHRFMLGRKRRDFSDKLVDYVVAWESLLLTSGGSPIAQEMSYRFALNGASLLSLTQSDLGPRDTNTILKQCYVVRSKIVHGGSESEINKALAAANFTNISEMCVFLESQYRQAVLYLHSMPRGSRPYIQTGGWEELIWPQ